MNSRPFTRFTSAPEWWSGWIIWIVGATVIACSAPHRIAQSRQTTDITTADSTRAGESTLPSFSPTAMTLFDSNQPCLTVASDGTISAGDNLPLARVVSNGIVHLDATPWITLHQNFTLSINQSSPSLPSVPPPPPILRWTLHGITRPDSVTLSLTPDGRAVFTHGTETVETTLRVNPVQPSSLALILVVFRLSTSTPECARHSSR